MTNADCYDGIEPYLDDAVDGITKYQFDRCAQVSVIAPGVTAIFLALPPLVGENDTTEEETRN